MPELSHEESDRLRRRVTGIVLCVVVSLLPLGARADRDEERRPSFGERIAGLYLSIDPAEAHVFQLNADGQYSYMESQQFSGWPGGAAFSNELGTWRRSGRRELIATSLHIEYGPDTRAFEGLTVLRRTFRFERGLNSFTVLCSGSSYAPGVDPFDAAAEATSVFECPERSFRRVYADD